MNRFRAARYILSRWNREEFKNIMANIRAVREALAQSNQSLDFDGDDERVRRLRLQLNHLLKLEEVLWFQKSRLTWQLDGDRCTCFFFLSTLTRRKFN